MLARALNGYANKQCSERYRCADFQSAFLSNQVQEEDQLLEAAQWYSWSNMIHVVIKKDHKVDALLKRFLILYEPPFRRHRWADKGYLWCCLLFFFSRIKKLAHIENILLNTSEAHFEISYYKSTTFVSWHVVLYQQILIQYHYNVIVCFVPKIINEVTWNLSHCETYEQLHPPPLFFLSAHNKT